jgi:hypothetical protein
MRHRLPFARGLALAVTLVMALPVASAAPARRGKPKKHAAPTAAEVTSTPNATDTASSKPEDSAKTKPGDSALAQPEPKPPAPAETPAPSTSKASGAGAEATSLPAADRFEASGTPVAGRNEDSNPADAEALGRPERARLTAGRSEVGVSLSIDIGNRRFKYSDGLGNALRPYDLPVAPMVSFGLEAYPLAASDLPVLRDLGFRGRFSRAFGLDSTTPDGAKLDTSWTRFSGEVRERLLVPGLHALEFGAFFGADASYFVMSSQSQVKALLPSARTISLRFGLDGRVLVAGRLSSLLEVAYLHVTSPGEIYERFRDPHVAGLDGGLGFALALMPGLEARLTGRYTRYFATFRPKVGDRDVAGGALDEQLQVGLGVRYAN